VRNRPCSSTYELTVSSNSEVECVWNVMAHAQKPDFVFRRNGRVHLNRQERQFSRLLVAELCASAVVMRDTPSSEVVKSTGYPLHSPVSPSLFLPCVAVCHHVSTGLYSVFLSMTDFNNIDNYWYSSLTLSNPTTDHLNRLTCKNSATYLYIKIKLATNITNVIFRPRAPHLACSAF